MQGLSSGKAQELLGVYGKNEIKIERNFSIVSAFIAQFKTLLNGILFVGAMFSLLIGNVVDAVFILAILVLSAVFGFIQEYNAEKSLEKLKEYVKSHCVVIRDGERMEIETSLLVPGDLVILSEGESVPADGKIIAGRHIEIDESILTGESIPVAKQAKDEVYSGTIVSKGRGKFIVETTGDKTKFGQIAQNLAKIETAPTPLQQNLNSLGKIISFLAIGVSLLLIPLGITQGRNLFDLILLSISAAVAVIPEGLPAVLTIALAIGTTKMAKKNAIVRKMSAVETLGAVQIILSDKTGTLTQNKMVVKEVWNTEKENLDLMYKSSVIANSATIVQKGEGFEIAGDKTDGSLLLWTKEKYENFNDLTGKGQVVDEFTFDPESKLITSVWEENSKNYLFVRGAPENILELSKTADHSKIAEKIKDFAQKGYRVIGFGYKSLETNDVSDRKKLEKDLTFLGIVGIYDPPRKEAIEAIKDARNAGIKTVMVTGDNEFTALTIAKEVGLIEKDEEVLTGEDLKKLNDEELVKIILNVRVFARTKPEDKLRLATIYKNLGFVVGVTGDGVNDSLALKKADVGIAMGKSGTDVAKESSDIVLSDDNFSTLIRAVLEGRTIYANIVKSITYLLSGNLSEISLILFASLLKLPDPLLPTQILWINLVTDGLPALALASDNRSRHVLSEKPRNIRENILTKRRIVIILLIGFAIASFLLTLYISFLNSHSHTFARTVVFNALVFSHMGLAFLVRGYSIFKINKILLFSVAFTILLQLLITFSPFRHFFYLGLE